MPVPKESSHSFLAVYRKNEWATEGMMTYNQALRPSVKNATINTDKYGEFSS